MYQDAYVRLSPHGAIVVGQPIGPGNLLFVDVMRDVPISELRRLPFQSLPRGQPDTGAEPQR